MKTFEKIQRVSVPALDEILGHAYPVLDDGFVRLVDYMGNDASIVQAARVSYGNGTKTVSEDSGLIRYLLRHSHTTPLEMCELKLHIRIPMDCWRQFIRHRTANVNEYSTRYSDAIDEKAVTLPDAWRLQSGVNKQGSSGFVDGPKDYSTDDPKAHDLPIKIGETEGEYLSRREAQYHGLATALYQERLDKGVAREQARKDLPLSTYTEAYWKCDLHNILHFLSLRLDSHAQLEIRSYANVMYDIVKLWCPLAVTAWDDYNFRRGALLLTARDKMIIRSIIHEDSDEQIGSLMKEYGWFELNRTNRERSECETKLVELGYSAPWLETGFYGVKS